jgi:hypothetical protein
VLSLLFGLVVIALVSAGMSLTAIHARAAARHRERAQARAAAESGAAACLAALRAGESNREILGKVGRGAYRARLRRVPSGFAIESTGEARTHGGLLLQHALSVVGTIEAGQARYSSVDVKTGMRRAER